VSVIYRAARTAFVRGQVDVMVDQLMMVMVGVGYVLDDHHDDIVDLTDQIGGAVVVSVVNVVDGVVTCNPVTFTAVPDGTVVAGLVTYVDGTGLLLGYADRRADNVPLNPTAGTGGDLTFDFVDYLLKI
jgi:hypothetical protein